jgi:hypothetical protein
MSSELSEIAQGEIGQKEFASAISCFRASILFAASARVRSGRKSFS